MNKTRWTEGYEAFHDGVPSSFNPGRSHKECEEWLAGYTFATDEEEREFEARNKS